jgi:hypothetical protein
MYDDGPQWPYYLPAPEQISLHEGQLLADATIFPLKPERAAAA